MKVLFPQPARSVPLTRAARPAGHQSRAIALAWLPALALLAGCSGSQDDKSAKGIERELEFVHEACDVTSGSARGVDVNNDGKADIVHVMSGAKEVCRAVDLNFDGSPDAYIYYDEAGKERRRESDFDRDGRPDEIAIFDGGVPKEKRRETNSDGKLDTWDYYQGDRLVKRERDSNGDGTVDQWWDFNRPDDPRCAVVASDANADGAPDPSSAVDLCADPNAPVTPVAPITSASATSSAPAGGASTPAPVPPSPSASAPVPSASASTPTPGASATTPKP